MTQPKKKSDACNQALEMRMREVLDGLEEIAHYVSYQAIDDSFEVLSIEQPPEIDPVQEAKRASVHDFRIKQKQLSLNPAEKSSSEIPDNRRQKSRGVFVDVADYLIAREQQHSQHH
ncbi:MAG: hypothetical protein OQK73_04735 [Gammaproteobacteria bacterium]|nr:hypothetical protein [Gammaproteobacteria bacterium]